MNSRSLLALAAALLMFMPAAEAAPKPAAYFLQDGDNAIATPDPGPLPPPVPPLPVGVPGLVVSGDAVLEPYDPKLGNFPNGTQPHLRLVNELGDAVAPLQFITPANHSHPDRIKGYMIVGLWPGQSLVVNGNMSATIYEVPESGDAIALAAASVALDLNLSKAPNATSLVPPNSTDPAVIVFYELGQVLPLVLQPPSFFLLGPVDVNLTNGSRLALGIALEQGSSPAPIGTGTATVQYGSIYTPSYVVVPWYAPDPVKTSTSKSSSSSVSLGPDLKPISNSVSSSASTGGGKESPGLGIAFLGIALLAVAVAARRRL